MIRFVMVCLSIVFLIGLLEPVSARPEFLNRFQSDPLRRTDVDGCATCHVNPRGGGPRTDFGAAFSTEGFTITPMLRANFPDNFKFETVKLPNGSAFFFSDPENRFVVVEREKQKVAVEIATLTATRPRETAAAAPAVVPIPPAENRMTFFVTSKSPGKGGHLGGLAGADRFCQSLAETVGAGDRTWRAYLSTSYEDKPAVNAGDRIGDGPWFNAKGMLVARGVADLHAGGRLSKETMLDEKGQTIDSSRNEILTGSLVNGTAAVGLNCNNWSSNDDGKVMVGTTENKSSWNSSRPANACSAPVSLFYCFAAK